MAEKFELYKKLAVEAQNKLKEILDITNKQFDSMGNDEIEQLTTLTEKREKLIDEFNLVSAEMDKLFSETEKEENVLDFERSNKGTIEQLKNDIFEANKKLEKIITLEMDACKNDIKSVSKNKEALSSYGNLDYPAESAYFDKKNC